MRVAAIQMNSGDRVPDNLALAESLIATAARDGCRIVVLPENFALMPKRGRDKNEHAEVVGSGPVQAFLAETARTHGVWIIGGSIPIESPEPERVFGACVVVNDEGETVAVYRKIHLFDVDISDSDESYRESFSMYPADDVVTVDTPAGRLGMSICYDVRFPELYRALLDDGASWFTVPAAFTVTTGQAHWHALLRARAIENLAYVVAPGQFGTHPDGRSTFGHSLIVDPWGRVLAESSDSNGFIAVDFELDMQAKLRSEFPALSNRRLSKGSRH
ncbi:MAG: carbon-nitrogen hydrolase family protein [Woeseiaceae bacterium]|nr:carbon-nitrogen hydrolase family protein [Woeseiaceae bacterium]